MDKLLKKGIICPDCKGMARQRFDLCEYCHGALMIYVDYTEAIKKDTKSSDL
jgi:hypothetical protein